jgi:hypothetical protein
MMGRLNRGQEQLFYSFKLDEAVPDVGHRLDTRIRRRQLRAGRRALPQD